jgi:hypothetical protein
MTTNWRLWAYLKTNRHRKVGQLRYRPEDVSRADIKVLSFSKGRQVGDA